MFYMRHQVHSSNFLVSTDIIISFSLPEYTAPEEDGKAQVCLTISAILSEPVTVVLLALEKLPVDARGEKIFH